MPQVEQIHGTFSGLMLTLAFSQPCSLIQSIQMNLHSMFPNLLLTAYLGHDLSRKFLFKTESNILQLCRKLKSTFLIVDCINSGCFQDCNHLLHRDVFSTDTFDGHFYDRHFLPINKEDIFSTGHVFDGTYFRQLSNIIFALKSIGYDKPSKAKSKCTYTFGSLWATEILLIYFCVMGV